MCFTKCTSCSTLVSSTEIVLQRLTHVQQNYVQKELQLPDKPLSTFHSHASPSTIDPSYLALWTSKQQPECVSVRPLEPKLTSQAGCTLPRL